MKKALLFFAVALASATGLFAQKQAGGEKNLEVQFAPLGGNPVSISGLRFRMFNADGTGAIRVGLFIGGTNEKEVNTQAKDLADNSPELITTNSTFDVSIRPGYEKHFAGTERLSPYVGGEIVFGISREKEEIENWSTNSYTNADANTTWTETTTGGSTTLGVNLLAGMDFYFTNHLYIGTEIGFGFQSVSQGDDEFEVSDLTAYKIANQIPEETTVTFDPFTNGSSSGWGPNFQGTLRLGWLF